MIILEDSKHNELEDMLNSYLEEFHAEFELYLQAIKDIRFPEVRRELNLPRDEILKTFSLTSKKLRDPFYIPEIIQLAYYMKENNFNYFQNYWNTYGYNHHEHGYRLKEILEKLQPLSEKIETFKAKKLEDLLEKKFNESKEKEIHISEPFIIHKFVSHNLPAHYDSYIQLINESAEVGDFYKVIPILLRCLFESLLYELFTDSLSLAHRDLYYNKYQKRARGFSQLIELLNFLKDNEYKPLVLNKINKITINILNEIKDIGNYSVHDTLGMIKRIHINDLKSKVDLALNHLLVSYDKLKGKNHEIESERLILIKKKFGLIKRKPGKKKKKKVFKKKKLNKNREDKRKMQVETKENIRIKEIWYFYDFLTNLFNLMEPIEKPENDLNFKDNRNYIYFKYQLKDEESSRDLTNEEVKHVIIDASDKIKRFYIELGFFPTINEVNEYISGYHLKLLYSRIKIEVNKVSVHRSKESLIPSPKNLKTVLSYFLSEIKKLIEDKISSNS